MHHQKHHFLPAASSDAAESAKQIVIKPVVPLNQSRGLPVRHITPTLQHLQAGELNKTIDHRRNRNVDVDRDRAMDAIRGTALDKQRYYSELNLPSINVPVQQQNHYNSLIKKK